MPRLERNLRLYGWHQALAGTLFWMPTVVLFLTEQVGLTTALAVQSAYYFAVVVLELPSGWLSDRLGRVIALRIVALTWIAAHVLFAWSPGSAGLIVAQVLLAAGYAFLSGTDVTFHYDTLEALGREDEFEEREAAARQHLLLVTASSALVGGALGTIDLRLPFLASAAFAAVQGATTLRMTEPGATGAGPAPDEVTSRTVFGYLRRLPCSGWPSSSPPRSSPFISSPTWPGPTWPRRRGMRDRIRATPRSQRGRPPLPPH